MPNNCTIKWLKSQGDLKNFYLVCREQLGLHEELVLDFSEVSYFDNLHLGLLVELLSEAKRQDKVIRLSGVTAVVNRILLAAKLVEK